MEGGRERIDGWREGEDGEDGERERIDGRKDIKRDSVSE